MRFIKQKKYNFKSFIYILVLTAIFIFTGSVRGSETSIFERACKNWWEGSYNDAEHLFIKAVQNSNTKYKELLNLAAFYRATGKYSEAAAQYKALLSELNLNLNPESSSEINNLHNNIVKEVLIPLAESLYYSNKPEDSLEILNIALKKIPNDPGALFCMGRVLYSLGKYDEAAAAFSSAVISDPHFPGNLIYLARIAEKKNSPEKALVFYLKALEKDSQQAELYFSLGENYMSLSLYEDAFKQFHRLRNIDSGNKLVQAMIERVRPNLTRKEEDIITVRALEGFSKIQKVPRPESIPLIKIGLNADSGGNLIPMKTVSFITSAGFRVIDDGKVIFSGLPDTYYTITFNDKSVVIIDQKGQKTSHLPNRFTVEQDESIIIKRIEYARGYPWAGIEDRQYRGGLEVRVHNGEFTLVNVVNLEEYLYSVVPSEMRISSPLEALKAQAVIARSYALFRKNYVKPHKNHSFDLCDSQHCQVYRGSSNEWDVTTNAVNLTRGEVLHHKGRITEPLFHSNCGGHTQSSGNLQGWWTFEYLTGVLDAPDGVIFPETPVEFENWLKSKPQVYCYNPDYPHDPEFRWFRLIPAHYVEEKVNRYRRIGNLTEITITRRNPSGYVGGVRVSGTEASILIVKEHEIRRLLGLGPLRSNLFWLETKNSKDGKPEEFLFYGGGWGHGVGMCQSGAGGMARSGANYKKILKHYYLNTEIRRIGY